jgi:hypothetical protein
LNDVAKDLWEEIQKAIRRREKKAAKLAAAQGVEE